MRAVNHRMRRTLRVADFFCGAGGFSEGFRLHGYEIASAIDSWKAATEAYAANHEQALVVQKDICAWSPSEFTHPDVVVGSPPCNEFSYSNKAGGGDLERGLKLVLKFLACVEDLNPKYWIMENVPRLGPILLSEGFRDELKKQGISVRLSRFVVLNAADYGAPQRRRRLFVGDFPTPEPTHSQGSSIDLSTWRKKTAWVPMRRVFESLPNPLDSDPPKWTCDPNYLYVRLRSRRLQNHFYDTSLSAPQVTANMNKKAHHPWCGKMRFPDDLDSPSRTVTATQIKTGRETIVIEEWRNRCATFRIPTVREYGCLQTFPIDYRFPAEAAAATKLVGNAVPPMMASAIAAAVLELEGLHRHSRPPSQSPNRT